MVRGFGFKFCGIYTAGQSLNHVSVSERRRFLASFPTIPVCFYGLAESEHEYENRRKGLFLR